MSFSRARAARIWSFVRPDAPRLGAVLVLVLLTTSCGLAQPVLLELLIDRALAPPFDHDMLYLVAGLMGAAGLLRFGAGFGQSWMMMRATTRVLFRMRQAFFRHLQRLPLDVLQRTPSGEILTRFGRDIGEIQSVATGTLLSLVVSSLTIVGSVTLLLFYNPGLCLVASVPILPAFLLARTFRKRLADRTREVREANEKVTSFLVESLAASRFTRAAGRTSAEAGRFGRLQGDVIERVLRAVVVGAAGSGLPALLLALTSLAVLLAGGAMVIRGEEELGDLIAFTIIQGRLFGPVQGLLGLYLQLQRATVSIERIFEYLERPATEVDPPGAVPLRGVRGEIAFEDVGLRWASGRVALDGVTAEIPAGCRVAVIGASGSGKSTLVDLLLGLRRPDRGRILIDQVDVATVTRRSHAAAMALVSQEPFLFHETLAENVARARRGAGDADVTAAIEAAGLGPLVARLPEGESTLVGERGAHLSGGEKQRVGLARAILRDPPIIVLDEATAHLDRVAAHELRQEIARRFRDRTTVVVTHDPEAVVGVDLALVFGPEGRLAGVGAPSALQENCPEFRDLTGVPS